MSTEEIKQYVQTLNEMKSEFDTELQFYLADETIPLEERWETFIEVGTGKTSWRTDFDESIEEEWLYESPLYMNKYETSSVDQILEGLTQTEGKYLHGDEEAIEKFKRYCMKGRFTHMKFDW